MSQNNQVLKQYWVEVSFSGRMTGHVLATSEEHARKLAPYIDIDLDEADEVAVAEDEEDIHVGESIHPKESLIYIKCLDEVGNCLGHFSFQLNEINERTACIAYSKSVDDHKSRYLFAHIVVPEEVSSTMLTAVFKLVD